MSILSKQKKTLYLYWLLSCTTLLNAFEPPEKLKALIVGKVAKYVQWKSKTNKQFIITLINDPSPELFYQLYKNQKIKNRSVKINHISSIDELHTTDILYIPKGNTLQLSHILESIDSKDILTISDIRGFAQKGGMIQLSFVSQKIKLKVNTGVAKEHDLHITPTLLRIADRVKGNNQ
jgi:hypothetical protein